MKSQYLTEAFLPQHECGIFAVYGHLDASLLTYYGLFSLQHRGQESAGIASSMGDGSNFSVHKGMGLVSQVFNKKSLQSLPGFQAIGHVRYSTTGSSTILNSQPLVVDTAKGQIAVAHNGNLVNASYLRNKLEVQGSIFQTTVDSEIVLHLLAQPCDEKMNPLSALNALQGAFSLVLMGEKEIIGVRDPYGFRPLSLGKLDGAWILSSETVAFDLIGAKFVRDINPGEVVIIGKDGVRSQYHFPKQREAFCIFEYIYFARPDSILRGVNVSQARMNIGRSLARLHPVDADIVIPIPDSGVYAALGFSQESSIPYTQAFVRNHYIGRTFIQPTQVVRDFNVRVKLNIINELIANKKVVIVDDSIVRGTTAKAHVKNLREAGAKEVHLRISCPPHKYPCYYGIDFPDPRTLIANQYTHQEIADYLGADSVQYLNIEEMVRAINLDSNSFCMACFNKDYPVQPEDSSHKLMIEKKRAEKNCLFSYCEDTEES